MAAKKAKTAVEQITAQTDDLFKRLEEGTDGAGSPLSPNQRAMLIRELRQLWTFQQSRENSKPVDEHRLAESEPFQQLVKKVVRACKDCDQCSAAIMKSLKVK